MPKKFVLASLTAGGIVYGYDFVTAPKIQLPEPVQGACAQEILDAVNACRADALKFNLSSQTAPESPLGACLLKNNVKSPIAVCTSGDFLFSPHLYVGGISQKE